MSRKFRARVHQSLTALMLLLLGSAAGVLYFGALETMPLNRELAILVGNSGEKGFPRLLSIERLPSPEGEMCEWAPARWEQQPSALVRSAAASADTKVIADGDRVPERTIRDTYPTYSAVVVDTSTGEVYLQDENLFGFRVFNRSDNTPSTADFTEPKRIVGGLKTKLEFNCALYVDPNTGDVYSVNNDMVDTMTVFPRDAKGNVAPQRELLTAHRSWGIAVDEQAQELFLTVEAAPQVLVYRKTAHGDEAPIRMLEGNHTRLEDPHGIAVDPANQLMFIANHGAVSYYETAANAGEKDAVFGKPHAHGLTFGLAPRHRTVSGSGKFNPPSITIYPLKAAGDTPPVRQIQGPKTQLNWPATLYLDEKRGELYVANDAADSILVFRASDNGDVAPLRVIQGAKTGLKNPTGVFIDTKNNELWVSNMGNHSATVYPLTASGDVAPLRTIRSAPRGKLALAIGNPGAVGYDSKREEILVPN